MNQALKELVDKKQKEGGKPAIDWDNRRKSYVAAVEALYQKVLNALKDAIDSKAVVQQRRVKTLTEDHIGTYEVDELILQIGNEQVLFSPVGRNIVGASGRVDVVGDRATAVLITFPKNRWSFVASRQPTLQAVDLDDGTLAEVLKAVMGE